MSSVEETTSALAATRLGSPVDMIPDELLACVFTLYDDRFPLSDHKPTPHILSAVDRRWRRVAVKLPSLWNHIILTIFRNNRVFSPPLHRAHPLLWIERSQPIPLDISIELNEVDLLASKGAKEALLDIVLPHIDRWRSINVIAGRADDLRKFIVSLDNAAARVLQEAVVITRDKLKGATPIRDNSYHGHRAFLQGGTPSLCTVRLIGMCHFSTIPLHGLTSLDLRNETCTACQPTYKELCGVIAASPALKHLTLHSLNLSFPEDTDLTPIAVESLTSLSINFRLSAHSLLMFLSLLSAPALEEIELISMGPSQIRDLPDLFLKKLPHPEYRYLHTFKLAVSTSYDDNDIERLIGFFCPSNSTFISIRNQGFSMLPLKTEILIIDPGDLGLQRSRSMLKYLKENLEDSPLRLIRVPHHTIQNKDIWSHLSTMIHIEIVDDVETLKYTGEDDSDAIAAEVVWDEYDYDFDDDDENQLNLLID